MKSTARRTILATGILALVTASAFAQTWTGGGDNISWNQAANWNSLPVSGPGTGIVFNNPAAVVSNQNLGNPFVLNSLQVLNTGGLTVNGNGLSFNNGASDAVLFANTTVPSVALNVPVAMVSNLQISNQMANPLAITGPLTGAGQLRISYGVTTLSGVGSWTGGTIIGYLSAQGTLRIAAANALAGPVNFFAGTLEFATPAGTFANVLSGGGGTIRQAGPGTVTLTGNNSGWNGTVDVASGTLIASHVNALGGGFSGASVQSGGTLQAGVNNALTPVVSGLTIQPGGTLDLAGFQQTSAVNVANNGAISLPGGSSLLLGNGTTWTGGSSGAGALSFTGNYTLDPGTNLTHTGGTTIVSGFHTINASNALPNVGLLQISGGNLFHNATETVDAVLVNGGNLGSTTLNVTNAMTMETGSATGNITVNGAFAKTTAGTASYGSGTLTMAAGGTVSAGTWNVNGAVTGTLTNNANITLGFGGALNGPVTNNATLDVGGNGSVNGAMVNPGTINLTVNGSVSGTVAHTGTIAVTGFNGISADVSGTGNLTVNAGGLFLSGINSYTGGSVATNSNVQGTTDSIQGAWTIPGSSLTFFQNTPGTMAGLIMGSGGVTIAGTGNVILTANNTYTGGVNVFSGHFGIGSNTAAGVGGTIQSLGQNLQLSAEGGARTLANPLVLSLTGTTEFSGTNNLTFTDPAAKTISGAALLLHTSAATTTVGGTFLGQNTTAINVTAGTLVLGAPVNNGFRMDGAINVAGGATLQMISNSPVKLGPTSLTGGTLIAANGVAVPTGLALTANGAIQARVSSEAGSLIEAFGGPLTMGDAASFGGFFSNGELRTGKFNVSLLDKNQAVLGSLTEVGDLPNAASGTLNAANGLFVDFGRAITGWGTVASTNALPQATIINGDAEGASGAQPLDFTGYVKGLGTFTDVTFSGTFSPGLSPAIVPVNNVNFGAASTLLMEIGGLTPGTQHDQLDIGGVLGLNGLLDVDLINGFNPASGNVFNILDGTTSGTFSSFSFPALAPGLSWDTSDLYTVGNLKIVPEPSAALLLVSSSLAFAMRRRRK